jgi:hypothetical protein
MFPVALQAAGGDLDDGTDDDAQAGGPLDRSRVIIGDSTLRTSGLLAAAALASTPASSSRSSTSPTNSCHTPARTRRTA